MQHRATILTNGLNFPIYGSKFLRQCGMMLSLPISFFFAQD